MGAYDGNQYLANQLIWFIRLFVRGCEPKSAKGKMTFLFYYNDGLCTICIWVKLKGEIIRRNEKLSLNFSIYATNTKSVFWTQNPHIIILSSLWLYCDSNLFLTIDVLLILERIRWHPFFFFQVIPLNIFPSHIFYRVMHIAKLALDHYDKNYIIFVLIPNILFARVMCEKDQSYYILPY